MEEIRTANKVNKLWILNMNSVNAIELPWTWKQIIMKWNEKKKNDSNNHNSLRRRRRNQKRNKKRIKCTRLWMCEKTETTQKRRHNSYSWSATFIQLIDDFVALLSTLWRRIHRLVSIYFSTDNRANAPSDSRQWYATKSRGIFFSNADFAVAANALFDFSIAKMVTIVPYERISIYSR